MSQLLWPAIRAYAALRRTARTKLGVRIKGLGFLLRRLRTDHEFQACGYHWYLDHRIADVYAAVLAGSFLEAETHSFLNYIADHARAPFSFIDVGANYGEMAVTMSAHHKVARVIAFEPHPVCAQVLTTNLRLNGAQHAEVHADLVGTGSPAHYVIDSKSAALSGIRPNAAEAAVPTVRLDDVLDVTGDCVVLIDVEGAELDVMKGAAAFIQRAQPLIIFEYHQGTRQRFPLADVRTTLGAGYELFRLRADGMLDELLDADTWNCVAVDTSSAWLPICRRRTVA